jgi:hypothetical protein
MWLRKGRTCRIAVGVGISVLLMAAAAAPGHAQTIGTSQSVTITIGPAAKLSVPASVSLTSSGAAFVAFTNPGTFTVSFHLRTSPGSGTGSIEVKATSDFASGGPSIAAGALTCTCASASPGACLGAQTVSTLTGKSVATFGPAVTTGSGAVQLNFSIPNDPAYKTGSYSASLLFTISSS